MKKFNHRDFGAKLQIMSRETQKISVRLETAYNVRSRAVRLAQKADAVLSDLRCELDSLVCREHPSEAEVHRLYYGRFAAEDVAGQSPPMRRCSRAAGAKIRRAPSRRAAR